MRFQCGRGLRVTEPEPVTAEPVTYKGAQAAVLPERALDDRRPLEESHPGLNWHGEHGLKAKIERKIHWNTRGTKEVEVVHESRCRGWFRNTHGLWFHSDNHGESSRPNDSLLHVESEDEYSSADEPESDDDFCWVADAQFSVGRALSGAVEAGRGGSVLRSATNTWLSLSPHLQTPSHAADLEEAAEANPYQHRVQVYFDEDGWRDMSRVEAAKVCGFLAAEVVRFELEAQGHEYAFDFSTIGEATQTHTKTGKVRKLRMLDGFNTLSMFPEVKPEDTYRQKRLGPQSKRGKASQNAIGKYLGGNTHAEACFKQLAANEERLCGEWAVFYHSYSFAALIYEVHAAVANLLFGFPSKYSVLPRLLAREFNDIPDSTSLIQKFNTDFVDHKRDHNPGFRKVGVSVMCSLASTGPEACLARVFVAGYSCKDVSFNRVLEKVLESCNISAQKVAILAKKIVRVAETHGLDCTQFGGASCQSKHAGHLLQIFIRRNLVDHLCYAAAPYGYLDEERMPLSKWMDSDSSFNRGQARIVAHPKFFMEGSKVRCFVASADPTFHKSRAAFQDELCKLIGEYTEPAFREKAAAMVYGGTLPSWYCCAEHRSRASPEKILNSK